MEKFWYRTRGKLGRFRTPSRKIWALHPPKRVVTYVELINCFKNIVVTAVRVHYRNRLNRMRRDRSLKRLSVSEAHRETGFQNLAQHKTAPAFKRKSACFFSLEFAAMKMKSERAQPQIKYNTLCEKMINKSPDYSEVFCGGATQSTIVSFFNHWPNKVVTRTINIIILHLASK